MEAEHIASVLAEMGTLLEVRGENPFRCRAYHNAAQAVRALKGRDLAAMLAHGSLAETPGLGATMLAKIGQLLTTGRLPEHEELRQATPPGLVALLRVSGLGPKKIQALHQALKVESLADLRNAVESGAIAGLKGFGAKSAANILREITFLESAGDRILQSTALRLVAPVVEAMRQQPGVSRVEVCGSLRRRRETIGDLDVLAAAESPADVVNAFVALPDVATVLGHGPTKGSVRLAEGAQCDLRAVSPAQFPFALHYFTGSKDHNIAMRRRALARGLTLNEYALEGERGQVACDDEAGLFEALGLAYVPPELREGRGEIEAAEAGPIPRLIERGDLTGTFHCHTDWSDGVATLEEMAEAARAAGLHYLGIADHSRSAGYAGGLTVDRLAEQGDTIDRLNRSYGGAFRLFKGTECDILADGSLDFPDEVLDTLDYVVASVHSLFRMTSEEMTARIVRAVRNPRVTMLGHPTGRLLLAREGYPVDLDAVLGAAAEAGTMIEINANPHRLDLDDEHCRKAKALGITIVINPDAHSTRGLADLDYGIGVARRAWLVPSDVFNTRAPDMIAEQLARRSWRS